MSSKTDFEQEQHRSDMIDYLVDSTQLLLMELGRTKNWDRKREAIQRFAERVVRRGWGRLNE